MRLTEATRAASLICALLVVVPGALTAQQADTAAVRQALEQRLGTPVTQAEIIQQLRSSGATLADVQQQLRQLGLDPSIANTYFNLMQSGNTPATTAASPEMVMALQHMGVAARTPVAAPIGSRASTATPDTATTDTAGPDTMRGALPLFGRRYFARALTSFDPMELGPVDEDYQLGPGDQIGVVLTGDVEVSYAMEVSREGTIVLPDVGQVMVAGLTRSQLEARLRQRFAKKYSGIREGTAHVQVTLGRLRTNLVYLIGEVERPGAYRVSAMATLFNALYVAGGPSVRGSFRNVEVRRDGKVVDTFDLYNYFLRGADRGDIRLEQGDVVFVPVAGPMVSIQGAVPRPARYEVARGEGLRDVLRFAGGFEPDAVVRRVQIDRILPPAQRRPGIDRVMVDVAVDAVADTAGAPIALRAGDAIRVFAVSDVRRRRVTIVGAVNRPGIYEWTDSLTLSRLLARAEGLGEQAYTARVHIFRLNRADGTRQLISAALDSQDAPPVRMADGDSVVVLSRGDLVNRRTVQIDGFVKHPGAFELAEGMTLQDLILDAGGFTDGADTRAADVARLPPLDTRTDSVAKVFSVALSRGTDDGRGDPQPDLPAWSPDASEFRLEQGDRVFIRKAPGYEPLQRVAVAGQVMVPGVRVLENRETRLSDVIQRAGGVTPQAYVPGARLFRGGKLVATNLERALKQPGSRYDFVVEDGDSLFVPKFDPTVLVTGAVAFETRVPYADHRGLDYYIAQAGGYADTADRNRVSVTYQNGQRAIVSKLLFFREKPSPGPGATVYVPQLPLARRAGINYTALLTQALPALTAVLLAIAQLK